MGFPELNPYAQPCMRCQGKGCRAYEKEPIEAITAEGMPSLKRKRDAESKKWGVLGEPKLSKLWEQEVED